MSPVRRSGRSPSMSWMRSSITPTGRWRRSGRRGARAGGRRSGMRRCSRPPTASGFSPGFTRCAGSLVSRVCAAQRLLGETLSAATGVVQRPRFGVSPGPGCVVELGHELAVGSAGGGEFFAAFFELPPQIGNLLFQVVDLVVEGVDVGWGAESGLAPRLFAKSLGQAFFQVLDAGVEPDGAFVSGEQVGLQRGSGDRRAGAVAG